MQDIQIELQEEKLLINNVKLNKCGKSFYTLRQKYEPLIIQIARQAQEKFTYSPFELDDLLNELNYHFYNLIMSYDFEKNKKFAIYIKEFLYYKIQNCLREWMHEKHRFLNYYVTMHHNSKNIYYELVQESDIDVGEYLEGLKVLTDYEKEIIRLKIKKLSSKEIAKKLNKTVNQIDAAFHRVKSKIVTKEQNKDKNI